MSGGNFFLQPAYNESVSAVTATPSVMLGAVRVESGEEYLYLYNDSATSANAGNGVILSAHTGYSVVVSSVTGYDMFLAVVKHANVPAANYFWGLTRGFTALRNAMVGTALAVGDVIVAGSNGGVQNLNVSTTAICGSVGIIGVPAVGTVVSACASGGTGASQCYAFVRCLGT